MVSDGLPCAVANDGTVIVSELLSSQIHSFFKTLDPALVDEEQVVGSDVSPHEILRANVDRCMSVDGIVSSLTDNVGGMYAHKIAPVLHRLGLFPHMWSLWEVIMRGKRIAVFSPNAAVVSACVCCLANLVAPLPFRGHCRPYVRLDNNDIDELCATSQPALVGVTNPFLISRSFAVYDVILLLPNPDRSFAEPLPNQLATLGAKEYKAQEIPTPVHTCLGVGLGETGRARAAATEPGGFYQRPSTSCDSRSSENKKDEGYMHASINVTLKVLDPAPTSTSRRHKGSKKIDANHLVEHAFDQWSSQVDSVALTEAYCV